MRNISTLGKVEDLNILGCENVSDITCLTGVNTLYVSLNYITRGLEVLENVKDALFLQCDYNLTAELLNKLKASRIGVACNAIFSDASLLVDSRPRSKVAISDCPFVVDISSLSKVNSVILQTMSRI